MSDEVKVQLGEILAGRYLKVRYVISVEEYRALSEIEKAKSWEPVHDGDSLVGFREPLQDWDERQAYWAWEQENLSRFIGD